MNFLELAKERYSCKSMDGRRVEKEKLDLILESGRWAPTAKNLQGQRIYVVESEEGLAKIDRRRSLLILVKSVIQGLKMLQ